MEFTQESRDAAGGRCYAFDLTEIDAYRPPSVLIYSLGNGFHPFLALRDTFEEGGRAHSKSRLLAPPPSSLQADRRPLKDPEEPLALPPRPPKSNRLNIFNPDCRLARPTARHTLARILMNDSKKFQRRNCSNCFSVRSSSPSSQIRSGGRVINRRLFSDAPH